MTAGDRIAALRAAARAASLAQPHLREETVARRLLATWSPEDKDALALLYISSEVWNGRRARQLEIERAATLERDAAERWERQQERLEAAAESAQPEREDSDAEWKSRLRERETRISEALPALFPILRDDPLSLYERRAERERARDDGRAHPYLNPAAAAVPSAGCTALRANGLPCKATAMAGETVCAAHGGKGSGLARNLHGHYPHAGYCAAAVGGAQCRSTPEPGAEFCVSHLPAAWTVPARPDLPGDHQPRFREWLGGDEAYDSWLAGALERIGPDYSRLQADFCADWYPGGLAMYLTDDLVQKTAAETRLKVTAELLGSEFALGDGARVTWARATVEQHRQRIALLAGNAAGNVQAAARHQAAVSLITDAGAACLGEIARPPALALLAGAAP